MKLKKKPKEFKNYQKEINFNKWLKKTYKQKKLLISINKKRNDIKILLFYFYIKNSFKNRYIQILYE